MARRLKVFIYDIHNRNKPHFDKWMKLPFDPKPEAQAATSIDGKLIILNAVSDCNDKTETNQMHLFYIDDMTWRKIPTTIHKRDHCALVSYGRYIYAFGGFRHHCRPGMGLACGAERLDIDTLQ